MFLHVSIKITESLIRIGVIHPSDREIYRYGFQQGLLLLLNLLSALIIAVVMGMVKETLVFLGAFIPLRSFAGGFHLNSKIQCYVMSMIVIVLVLLAIKSELISFGCYYLLISISHIIIFFLSPVEDVNKRLDELERRTYQRLSRIIQCLELFVFVITSHYSLDLLWIPVTWAWFVLSLLIVMGYIKNLMSKQSVI